MFLFSCEMCGSKLASGDCFLAFSLIAVTLGTEIVILGILELSFSGLFWCLHFTILGAILSAWGRPGGPWEQQERHVGFQRQIFIDFG